MALPLLVRELVEAQERTERTLKEFAEATDRRFEGLDRRLEALAEAQERTARRIEEYVEATDRRIASLEAVVDGMRRDLGDLKGAFLETRVRAQPRRYVPRRIATGARLLTDDEQDQLLDSLEPAAAADVERADALLEARLPEGDTVLFVVEAAWRVNLDEIERATRRAAVLREAGTAAWPLVICQVDPGDPVLRAAREAKVLLISESRGLLTSHTPRAA